LSKKKEWTLLKSSFRNEEIKSLSFRSVKNVILLWSSTALDPFVKFHAPVV
jgi:hypothetical protein